MGIRHFIDNLTEVSHPLEGVRPEEEIQLVGRHIVYRIEDGAFLAIPKMDGMINLWKARSYLPLKVIFAGTIQKTLLLVPEGTCYRLPSDFPLNDWL